MKKLLCLLFISLCLNGWSDPAAAAPVPQAKQAVFDKDFLIKLVNNVIALHVDTPYAIVNNMKMPIDIENLDVAPTIIDGNTLVPARFIAESLGAKVVWDNATSQITIKHGDSQAVLKLNSDIMTVDNNMIQMEVPPQIINGRTMVPLRRLAEDLLNKSVGYKDGLIIIGNQTDVSTIIEDNLKTHFVNTAFVGTRGLTPEETSFKFNGTDRYVRRSESLKFLSELGKGDASASNHQGFIGWDASKRFKFYKYGYPAHSPEIYIYVSHDTTNDKEEVGSIDISKVGTSNGFRVGDSYRAVQFFYMHSVEKKDLGNGFMEYFHPIGAGDRLTFTVNSATNKVTGIEIRYQTSNAVNVGDTFDPSRIVPDNQQKMLTESEALAIVHNYVGSDVKVKASQSEKINQEKYYAFHASNEYAAYDYLHLVDKFTGELFIWHTDGTIETASPKPVKPQNITKDEAMKILEAKIDPIIKSYRKLPNVSGLGTKTINGKTYFSFEVAYTGASGPVEIAECYVSEDGSTVMMYDFQAQKEIPFNDALFKQYLDDTLPN